MQKTLSVCCQNGHEAHKFCLLKSCQLPSPICKQQSCQFSTIHKKCMVNTDSDEILQSLIDKGIEESQEMDDIMIGGINKMIKNLQIVKDEYMERRDGEGGGVKLEGDERKMFEYVRKGSTKELKPIFVSGVIEGLMERRRSSLKGELANGTDTEKEKKVLNEKMGEIKNIVEEVSTDQMRGLDKLRRCWNKQKQVPKQLTQSKIKKSKIRTVTENVLETQQIFQIPRTAQIKFKKQQQPQPQLQHQLEPQLKPQTPQVPTSPFFFSPDQPNHVYIHKNSKSLLNTSHILPPSYIGTQHFSLIFPSISFSNNQPLKLRVSNNQGSVRFGAAKSNIMSSQRQFYYSHQKDGLYLLRSNGFCRNPQTPYQHFKQVDFRFDTGDIVQVEYFEKEKRLRLKNISQCLSYTLEGVGNQEGDLCYCVYTCDRGEEWEIIE